MWRFIAALALLSYFPVAGAASAEPSGPLTLRAAIAAALAGNPELAAARYELAGAGARVDQAQLRINPQLALDLEDFAGSGMLSGTQSLQTTLSLSQVIELGDKRGRRSNVARAELEAADADLRARQLDVLAAVTQRFIDVVAAQQDQLLAQRAAEQSRAALTAIETRVQAARSPEAELRRARVAALRAGGEVQRAAARLAEARQSLATLWGSTQPLFPNAEAELFDFPPPADYARLQQNLRTNPNALRFVAEQRLRAAQLQLAQVQSRPNLNLSFGVRNHQDSDSNALVAGISLPLSLYDHGGAATRNAEAQQMQSLARQQAALLAAETTLYGLHQQMLVARDTALMLRDQALPEAEQALTQTVYGYERGRFSYTELAAAHRELLELQSAAIEAAADAHRLLAEIERLSGAPATANAGSNSP